MLRDRIHFRMMAIVHERMYGLLRDPYKPLRAAGVETGLRVLEVGCGPGFFTIPAAEIVGQEGSVTSLDVSPIAVAHVQEKVTKAGATNIELLVANAADTGLPGESFDLVLLFGLGHIVGDVGDFWAELHRLSKPEGVLAVEGRLQPPAALYRHVQRLGRVARFRKVG